MKLSLVKWEFKLVKNLSSKGHIIMLGTQVARFMPDMGHIKL